jgi:hypothetical protein
MSNWNGMEPGMELEWNGMHWNGFGMDLEWIWNGWNSFGMALERLWNDFGMVEWVGISSIVLLLLTKVS